MAPSRRPSATCLASAATLILALAGGIAPTAAGVAEAVGDMAATVWVVPTGRQVRPAQRKRRCGC